MKRNSIIFFVSICLLFLPFNFLQANAYLQNNKTLKEKIETENNRLLVEKKIFHLRTNAKYKPGEVIVKFKDNIPSKSILKKLNTYQSYQLKKTPLNARIISIPKGKKIEEFINELIRDPDVDYAQPNYSYKPFFIPNDPGYSKQWYLPKVQVPEAWDKLPQNGTVTYVAVIDNGVDINHPDLRNNILFDNYNAVNPTVPIDISQTNGHGTIVAGIIGATINNAEGISGISPNVKIMPINVFTGEEAYEEDIANGIYYAVNHHAKVINLSLGTYDYGFALKEAIDYAYAKGVVVVAAAGNDNTDLPSYPASFANVISVGATDENDQKAQFSNYGSTIDVVAPGTNILSTAPNGQYAIASGTSMASPIVAATAALLLSKNPNLTVDEVTTILLHSARDIGDIGADDTYGYGIINANHAISENVQYDLDAYEGNNSFESAKTISLGSSITAQLSSPGDLDFFKLSIDKRQRIRFRVIPPMDEDIVLEVFDGNRNKISLKNKNNLDIGDEYYEGGIEEFNLTLDPGFYYLKVVDANGSAQFRPYTLSTFYPVYERLAGKDRFETAVKVSQKGWEKADTVVLAYYNGFADALAGVPLAFKYNGPVLLTESNRITPVTKNEIVRLKAKNVIIVGGIGVVSTNIENELRDMGLNVSRLGGTDRFDTARKIAEAVGPADIAIIAYGLNFPDALAIAPYAAINGYPILLVETKKIPASTFQALQGRKKTIVVGGTGVISDTVFKQLPSPYRIAGQDRYQTAVEIIRKVDASTESVYVATGAETQFADALTGAVLAAKNLSPMILTMPNQLPNSTRELIDERNILNFDILGGKGAVSDKVVLEMLK
ncbi:S8 family serine peptidase [Tepidibacillus sp. LV47]|uniref:S8 family serine peptidase n=1 Tax=Tepidibacillus sp. LV47 TaxID=3398228 RepID=UPI003AABB6CD